MNCTDNPALMILKAIWEAGTKDDRDRLYLSFDSFVMARAMIDAFYPGLIRDSENQQEDAADDT